VRPHTENALIAKCFLSILSKRIGLARTIFQQVVEVKKQVNMLIYEANMSGRI